MREKRREEKRGEEDRREGKRKEEKGREEDRRFNCCQSVVFIFTVIKCAQKIINYLLFHT